MFPDTLRSGDRLAPISRAAIPLPSRASLTSVSCHRRWPTVCYSARWLATTRC